MRRNEPLSPELQATLDIITNYHREQFSLYQDKRNYPRQTAKLSVWQLIQDLSGGFIHGENRDYLEAVAARNNMAFDPRRPFVEFRDLTKGVVGAGGHLVATEMQTALDILRPFSVTARLGIEVELGLTGDQAKPKTTVKSTPEWLATEGSGASPSQHTLAQIVLSPKQVVIQTNFSRQLSKQANVEENVRRELLLTSGTAIDQAVLSGSSANFQPTGILNTSGVQTISGTSLSGASANHMKRLVADADGPDEGIAFLGTPLVRKTLEDRERATGSGFVWDNDRVSSRPAFVTTDLPAGTLICGAWSLIYVGIWGQGFVLEINPYEPSNFKSGVIQARMLMSVDVAVLHPAAFCVATTVT